MMTKKLEKFGITEFVTVKTHARELYLPLKAAVTNLFDIKKGVKLLSKKKGLSLLEVRKRIVLSLFREDPQVRKWARGILTVYPEPW